MECPYEFGFVGSDKVQQFGKFIDNCWEIQPFWVYILFIAFNRFINTRQNKQHFVSHNMCLLHRFSRRPNLKTGYIRFVNS